MKSEADFEKAWRAFQEAHAGRPKEAGPPIAWRPSPETIARTNLARFWKEHRLADYEALRRRSSEDRAWFWEEAARRVRVPWRVAPRRTLDLARGAAEAVWFPGARLNISDVCLTPWAAPPTRTALLVGQEGSEEVRTVSHGALLDLVARAASGFSRMGLSPGDRVALYLPMTVECVAAYLGAVRAGLAVVSIADSFSAAELARRLAIGQAKAVVTVARYGWGGKLLDLYEKVRSASSPPAVVIAPPDGGRGDLPALRSGDRSWESFLGDPSAPSVEADPYDVTNVLFSSGTTADPKAIPWTHLTPVKCVVDGHFHQDIRSDDVVAWPTNIGWMMGPWLIYAALANGAAVALYVGAPSGKGFAAFVRKAGVTVLGVVPSLVSAWRAADAVGDAFADIRLFSSTGEAANAEDTYWLMSRARTLAPVIEYCGGTEIGGGHITGTVVQPASPATFTTAALGIDFRVLDEAGQDVPEGGMGELFVVPPSVGLSQRLLAGDHHAVYYAGCPRGNAGELLRRHGDAVARLGGGFYKALGRADDAMNLGGIKVSAYELEQVLAGHPAVREAAAIAVAPEEGGADRLVACVVLKEEVNPTRLRAELQSRLSGELNPLFRLHDVRVLSGLPRTASNKLMRRELRRICLARRAE